MAVSKTPDFPFTLGLICRNILYNVLRANFDGEYEFGCVNAAANETSDGPASYKSEATVTKSQDLDRQGVGITYRRGQSGREIGINSGRPSSTTRKVFTFVAGRNDVEYLTWRGTVLETSLYKIPGQNGSISQKGRLTNIVWYNDYTPSEMRDFLTDADRISHTYSLAAGKIRLSPEEEQRQIATHILSPTFAELWNKVE
ncbi:hypothetical protein BJ875DRAFT_484877 [Amylocarpus encephaloides]|uniref:2,6-dihydroxypyridine 3-monooxygenase substrate binding domain-containing protein n=1 Tax=Amylocarpus encephaloides TaxID=45428 RepID=A0A9P7YHS1_9HELO|nr:hypothetical protein BJ875DRAFT_484877 [Amylocarpus encephaloides]